MAKTDTVKELVDKALISLFMEFQVFGDMIVKIGVHVVNSKTERACAWTNGTGIYINECMVNALRFGDKDNPNSKTYKFEKEEMMFVLSHELMHLLNLTYDRGEELGLYKDAVSKTDRDKFEIWNMATDYEINSLLKNNKITDEYGNRKPKSVGTMLTAGLYDPKYIDVPAEEIYDKLLEEAEKNGSLGTGVFNFTFDGTENANGEGISLDVHMPMLDDATREEVLTKIQESLGSRMDGHTGSSALDRAFQRTFKPEPFNWKKALTKYIRGYIKANYTWNKPSRAGQSLGIILPSASKTPKMHIGVAIDTSGSISEDEIQTMVNHVFTILSTFKDFTVDVWCCGMKVYEDTFKSFTPLNKNELFDYKLKSDGCNDMVKNLEFVNKKYKADKLDALIILSDFYDEIDGNDECTCACPVIFLSIDHPEFKKPKRVNGVVFPYHVIEK